MSYDPAPAAKKPQPLPWTHPETLNLIQAYQEKWYSLQRGQLKANQWEEVAVTVATRCGLFDDSAAKTALQCRHKMEKLRRRYRSERQNLGSASPWPYYDAMESLEQGPLPISARPLASIVPNGHEAGNYYHNDDENNPIEEEEEDDEEHEGGNRFSKSRSINYILRRPSVVNRFSGLMKKRVRTEEEGDGDGDAAITGKGEEDKGVELAMEIRRFAERFMRLERKKMEIMHETERLRMEMENKRIEMILDSEKKIVDAISTSLGSKTKE
ncbi:trihelix transcription factor ENAP2 [Gossypium arboreum]|uniref:Myb/SANT-like DNA-binding domain-containing protein n=1 Tax=Gossypium arboreum TaxID=29729 RepID=A0ABR0PG30_GOSAR|nr:trihelix transcription factor ENAP2 [Gossypium arboreum]KAK5820148.1 hypothetical protein PVK06_025194 [Gossypium arboreum]